MTVSVTIRMEFELPTNALLGLVAILYHMRVMRLFEQGWQSLGELYPTNVEILEVKKL